MFFRLWYHACQLVIPALFAGMIGLAMPSPMLFSACGAIIGWIGIGGTIICLLSLTVGFRSACPICKKKAAWIVARRFLGVNCDACGIVGGYPLMHIVPFKVECVEASKIETTLRC